MATGPEWGRASPQPLDMMPQVLVRLLQVLSGLKGQLPLAL